MSAVLNIPAKMLVDTRVVWENALRRAGVDGELGTEFSALGAIVRGGGKLEFQDGGSAPPRIKYPYETGTTAEFYQKGDSAPAAGAEKIAEATPEWSYLQATIRVEHPDEAASRGANMESGEDSYYSRLLNEACKVMIEKLETTLHSGLRADGKSAPGIPYYVADDNTNLWGLNQSTSSWLQAKMIDASSASLSRTHLRNLMIAQRNDGATPKVLLCSHTQVQKYQELLDGKISYQQMQVGEIQFDALQAGGVPFFPVNQFPTNVIYSLDPMHHRIVIQRQDLTKLGINLPQNVIQGFPFNLVPLGRDGDHTKILVTLYYHYENRRPWLDGGITALATALA